MTLPIAVGAPDYSHPLSTAATTVLDTTLSLGAGTVSTPWILVEQFTGLIVEIQQITGDAGFGLLQVGFSDVNGGPGIQPTYVCNWRGNKPIKLNVPVMGQRVRFTFIGAASAFSFGLSVVAHGGGGHPGFGRNASVLASQLAVNIPATTTLITDLSLIREGPACLHASTGVVGGAAWVTVFDSTGAGRQIAEVICDAGRPAVADFYLPPDFCQLSVNNPSGATAGFSASVVLGRV